MRRMIVAAAVAVLVSLLSVVPVLAQNSWVTPGGAVAGGAADMCLNSSNLLVPWFNSSGSWQCAGSVNVTGTFSASLGGFTPSASGARGTPFSVTTADSSGTLPTGAVVVVSNPGANPMYCNVNGVAATTSDQPIAAGIGNWFAFTIPSGVTTLHCIATGGSTTANMLGGAGLATGSGGGGGGVATTVTANQPTASSFNATVTQGPANATPWNQNTSQWGGTAVTAATAYGTAPSGNVPGANVFVTNTNSNGQATMANSSPVAIASNQTAVPENTTQIGGNAISAGAGAVGTGSARIAVGQDSTTIAGSNPGRTYNTIAASQSAQVLSAIGGGGTGAAGDYLSHCVVTPTSTSPGVVTILDNATTIYAFPGGASSLSNLVPFPIPVGASSVSGAWKVTTGANLSVVCTGKFS